MFIKKLDLHILKEWLKSFTLVISLILGIIILHNLYDNLPDFLKYNTPPEKILRYYIILLPSLIPATLKISLLVSTLICFGTLHRNNEITAMRATGISLWRISAPMLFMGLCFAAITFYLNAKLVPWSVEESTKIQTNLRFASEEMEQDVEAVGLHYNLGFHNHSEHRLWYMNRFNERSYTAYGVNVYTRDDLGREIFRVLAREAYYDEEYKQWTFLEGRKVDFDPETSIPFRSLAFEELSIEEFNEDPTLMISLAKKMDDLSLDQLNEILQKLPVEDNPQVLPHSVKYHTILAGPIGPLLVVMMAIPFAVSGVRTNPMVGVSKGVGMFIVYFAISSLIHLLGERSTIPPILSAWLPQGIMAFFICIFLYKHR